jgi:DNA polymerase
VDQSERILFQGDAALPASDDWREMLRQVDGGARPKPPEPLAPPPAPAVAAASAPTPPTKGVLRIEGLVVPLGLRVERPSLTGPGAGAQWSSLADVTAAISACRGCALHGTATQPVPGVGMADADVMVVGEAPGEKEDLSGEPFVGPAGELLTKILGAIQLSRESVYICNVLKHRPPGNRNPMPDEVRACAPFLQRQIDLVQPRIILAFGTFAAQSLLGTKLAIGKLRQQVHWYQGIPLVATYHPAALLRNEAWKRPAWEDVKLARRVLDATVRS